MNHQSQNDFNTEVTSLISQLFMSNEAYKKNKGLYISQIKCSDINTINMTVGALKAIFENPAMKPETKLLALHFTKEAMDLNIGEFITYMKKFIFPIFLEEAQFQKDIKDDDRGKFFFSPSPDSNTKVRGNSYLRLLLESIEVWAKWYKNDPIYVNGYQKLVKLGVKFPNEHIYFKKIEEDIRIPLYLAKSKKIDEISEILTNIQENKKYLQIILLKDEEISFMDISNLMSFFSEIFKKSENILNSITNSQKENNVLLKNLEKERVFIEALLIGYNTSINNNEKNFDSLKEIVKKSGLKNNKNEEISEKQQKKEIILTNNKNEEISEKQRKKEILLANSKNEEISEKQRKKEIIKPGFTIESVSLSSNLVPPSLKKPDLYIDVKKSQFSPLIENSQKSVNSSKYLSKIDSQTMRTELLSSKSVFEENILKYLEILRSDDKIMMSIISFCDTIIMNPTEKAITRYLSLLLIKSCMDLDIETLKNQISMKILPKITEISKFNFRCKNDDKYKAYFGETTNENIEKLAEEFVLLAIQCIYLWSKLYPKNKIFLETYTYLRDLGIDFTVFDKEIPENNAFDEEFLEIHLKEVNMQIEELKNFLLKTKRTIKNLEFLPKMHEILESELLIFKRISSKNEFLEEAIRFIKEFKRRYRKLEEGAINYTQFKRRFLKYFGLSDLNSSKISSKMSTSDLTVTMEKPVKSANTFNNEKYELFYKIPEKKIENYVNFADSENFLTEFPRNKIVKKEDILTYLQEMKKEINRNLEIFVWISKGIFEESENYIEKVNLLNFTRICIDEGDIKIVQKIHDFLLRSIVIAIYQANFSKNGGYFDEMQENFRSLALESLKDWGNRYKQNIFLNSFTKAWSIITEELMIEIPEILLEKSSVLLDIKRIGGGNTMKKEENIEKSMKNSGISKKITRNTFKTVIFEENLEKIKLKGFKTGISLENRSKVEKLTYEVKLIKENIELMAKLREKDIFIKSLEKELNCMKEKLKFK